MRIKIVICIMLCVFLLQACGEKTDNTSATDTATPTEANDKTEPSEATTPTEADDKTEPTETAAVTEASKPEDKSADRAASVSEENRKWFDEDGNITFYLDITKLNAPERQAIIVPDEILNIATTEELFNLVLDWVYGITDPYIYNYPSHYINYVYYWFNAMPALFERDDLGKVLYSMYEKMRFVPSAEPSPYHKPKLEHKMALIEMMLAFDQTFDDFNDDERKEVIEKLYAESKGRESRFDFSGFFFILQEKGKEPFRPDSSPVPEYYNKNWYWNKYIEENCSDEIKEMLVARFF